MYEARSDYYDESHKDCNHPLRLMLVIPCPQEKLRDRKGNPYVAGRIMKISL